MCPGISSSLHSFHDLIAVRITQSAGFEAQSRPAFERQFAALNNQSEVALLRVKEHHLTLK
jgi:hypothetical protein